MKKKNKLSVEEIVMKSHQKELTFPHNTFRITAPDPKQFLLKLYKQRSEKKNTTEYCQEAAGDRRSLGSRPPGYQVVYKTSDLATFKFPGRRLRIFNCPHYSKTCVIFFLSGTTTKMYLFRLHNVLFLQLSARDSYD